MAPFFLVTVASVTDGGDQRGPRGQSGTRAGGAGGRIAFYYAAVFVGPGVTLPFLPAFLASRGLDPAEVAIALTAQQFARLLSGPLIGRAADAMGDRRRIAALSAAAGVLAALAVLMSSGPLALVLACGLAGAVTAPLVPLGDAVALRAAGLGLCDFGRVRGLGSIAFVLATLAGGVAVRHLGAGIVPLAMAGGFAATVAAALRLPAIETPPARGRGLGAALLRRPGFALLLLASGLIQGSHALHYGFSVLAWASAGIGPDLSGLLWTVGVTGEIALLLFGRASATRIGPVGLLAVGAGAGIVRWVVTALSVDPWIIGPLQLLHALSFGATMLGAASLLVRLVPPELGATAQTLHAALGPGLVTMLLTAASGPLYARFGGAAFLAMACVCAAALIPTALLARRGEARS
ncbi:MFS transporter [Elioraea sp.]|uniref:MFS transporter n=1 Tax=Elioraea sp. TaxID=2185103 RepID=UPI0025BA4DE8|nr:MFS transporter [Elioraea sp.]